MDGWGDHGEPVAIIGIACRFPGARDPAQFHELALAGRRMGRGGMLDVPVEIQGLTAPPVLMAAPGRKARPVRLAS
ncbi:MAG: beta-ketoacyl synthase N-terminal-like domain-containing protein [Streptosporangiaceae bacterium]|jgi:hypothetical protein